MATFGYGRVSTVTQTTDNQLPELFQAGYQMKPNFGFADEGINGKVSASLHPAFGKMLRQIRKGEMLVVPKLDRLGHSSIDVRQTVRSATCLTWHESSRPSLGNTDLRASTASAFCVHAGGYG